MNDSNSSAHPPHAEHPDDETTLGLGAYVTDVATGDRSRVDDWLQRCSQRESRPVDECRESLMNAIARGDLRVDTTGTFREDLQNDRQG